MSIEKVRKSVHKLVDEIDDEETLKIFQRALESEKEDEFKVSFASLSQEEREGIERGLKDAKEGRIHTHEDVQKSIEDEFGI